MPKGLRLTTFPDSAPSTMTTADRTNVAQPCSSLSRKLGSRSTFFSNFVHQSWKAFRGTVSLPKLARKLKALPMILCAMTFVVALPPEDELNLTNEPGCCVGGC